MSTIIPEGYHAAMDVCKTEQAIKFTKDHFERALASRLGLDRITAPLFVQADSGIQDNLNGTERAVSFGVLADNDTTCQIVHSLAKWKRLALHKYKFEVGQGIYTDMNALRPDEDNLDNIHSVYVDQWDWERVITPEERTLDTLKGVVRDIYAAIKDTEAELADKFHNRTTWLPDEIAFVHTEELAAQYPDATRSEREAAACKTHGAVFIIGIGGELPDGKIHDGRAPDYDDWTTQTSPETKGLNGDIFVWNPLLQIPFEISSMGIRVDADTMLKQLDIRGCMDRTELPWHKLLLDGSLPQSIGGGIGQSRLCMLLLEKAHIGEVQVSHWPKEVVDICRESGIPLL
ncbi:MAG: aspartate--ammonia ligase [Phycisphaerales bacterium]|nr:aspartate--ammonia ligase [Phycisphaerales bacterium]